MLLFLTALTAVFESFLLLFLLPFFEFFDQNSVTDNQKNRKRHLMLTSCLILLGLNLV